MEDSKAFQRLTARLATLDLDPSTLEMLTVVLTADLDLRTSDADGEARHDYTVPA
jgi:hypothetical protein